MANSLKDELASLKIDRRGGGDFGPRLPRERPARKARRPRGGGIGMTLLSLMLWVVPLGMLAAGGTIAYRQYQSIRSKPEVSVAMVQAMTSGEAEKLLSAKGYLKSRNQAQVGARIPGRLQELFAEEGTKVKRGQTLAILEHNDLDASLESKKAMALRAKADVEEARSDLELRKLKAERARRLQERNMSVSVEEMQQATTSVGMGEAHLASLEASYKLQLSQVREAEEALINMTIRAPFDGTVVEKPAEIGEMITGGGMGSGVSIGRSAVLTIANLDVMDVETDVAENLLSRIAIGQPAEISVAAVPNKHYRGRLRQIIPISDRARGTVKVKVEILDVDDRLFPELVATVHFLPDKSHQGPDVGKSHLFVNKAALFDEDGHSHVWSVDGKNTLHKTRVEVAVTNDDLARVETGLKAGDMVVLAPGKTLREGETVKLAD
ncbi:efflux RND transporter periplasmic adaptor subunit [Tundrisphaera sp. TA3]|uniref:efflux RND transporter periplasmic adaptor subunit n=1 Tax=Tundrisphaera sp. TA3 TaxID=3435775 RepID=UPI003EBD1F86